MSSYPKSLELVLKQAEPVKAEFDTPKEKTSMARKHKNIYS